MTGEYITPDDIDEIKSPGERTFAKFALSRANLVVETQIPVGRSIIDFRVTNTQTGESILVEVTAFKKAESDRKKRQIAAMEKAGGGVVLTRKDLINLAKYLRENGLE